MELLAQISPQLIDIKVILLDGFLLSKDVCERVLGSRRPLLTGVDPVGGVDGVRVLHIEVHNIE